MPALPIDKLERGLKHDHCLRLLVLVKLNVNDPEYVVLSLHSKTHSLKISGTGLLGRSRKAKY